MFKKAAYLSTGSVDSRPTFQRDAVDDDCTGAGATAEGSVNVISWKDMNLGKGPLQGAAYGSMVMPQFKGGRKANRRRKLPNLVAPDVSTHSPMWCPSMACLTCALCLIPLHTTKTCTKTSTQWCLTACMSSSIFGSRVHRSLDLSGDGSTARPCTLSATRSPSVVNGKLCVQASALPTSPVSMNMSAWAAMGETGAAGPEWTGGGESQGSDPSTAFGSTYQDGSTMGSIAGWQAIAADVSPPFCAFHSHTGSPSLVHHLSLGAHGFKTCWAHWGVKGKQLLPIYPIITPALGFCQAMPLSYCRLSRPAGMEGCNGAHGCEQV